MEHPDEIGGEEKMDNICIGELNDTIRSFTEAVDWEAYGDLSRFIHEPLKDAWSRRKLIEVVEEDFHFKGTTIRPGIVYGFNYTNTNVVTDVEKFKELIDTALANLALSLCWRFEDYVEHPDEIGVEFWGAVYDNKHYFPRLYLLGSNDVENPDKIGEVCFGWSLWYALVKEGKNILPLKRDRFLYGS